MTTGEPLYKERYRPRFHLTPPSGPMSDPNGMVYVDGEYHQFYQFTGRWGHAISRDLIHWEHLPLALVGDELGDIWSGSCVIDKRNTSGLFRDESGMVALFTHFKDGLQSQSMAYSRDRGRTWAKYEGNPVIPNPGLKDFRDPKVLWHEEAAKWVMVVSVDKEVYFYSSANLLEWRFESRFGEGQGCRAAVWECPDLFRLPVEGRPGLSKWVLHVSIGDNGETDGSTAQYFIGEFDGRQFRNDDESGGEVRWTDYGQDFYAAVTYSDMPEADGRTVWLGWTSNWKYPFAGPTSPWKGGMSVPRSLTLKTSEKGRIVLCQHPIAELESLREGRPLVWRDVVLSDGALKLEFTGSSYEIEAEAEWREDDTPTAFGLRVRASGEERTLLGYEPGAALAFLDRTAAGRNDFVSRKGKPFHFGKRFEAPHGAKDSRIRLRAFVDESVVELFVDGGETVFTSLVYPEGKADGIELFADGGKVVFTEVTVRRMNSAWV
ncbi:glycoside hydrolase family 32 protein [Paenibacillus sp. LHD-117]|uniref:glycoside hydrolase family 32 protein n=1 Tax=Paenibacillus sp. LHD-117 TaxID=3071412 RepID=UPI0027E07DCB|nr:glycoside hydrolase family 32 protein [Paenibacillus sp. LHD-117]MDQ6420302.1 glycoside hydrolase family 32 protein [Paenibacillus sp. LHD-117]